VGSACTTTNKSPLSFIPDGVSVIPAGSSMETIILTMVLLLPTTFLAFRFRDNSPVDLLETVSTGVGHFVYLRNEAGR